MHSVYSICFLEFQKIFSLSLVHLCIMNKNFISINTSVNFFHSSKCVSYFKDAYFLDNIYSWSSSKSPHYVHFSYSVTIRTLYWRSRHDVSWNLHQQHPWQIMTNGDVINLARWDMFILKAIKHFWKRHKQWKMASESERQREIKRNGDIVIQREKARRKKR